MQFLHFECFSLIQHLLSILKADALGRTAEVVKVCCFQTFSGVSNLSQDESFICYEFTSDVINSVQRESDVIHPFCGALFCLVELIVVGDFELYVSIWIDQLLGFYSFSMCKLL